MIERAWDIEKVRVRAALDPRREPYWRALATGQHLGYRRTDGGGHWIARAYDPATRKRIYRSIGDLARVAPTDQFTVASKHASEWFAHIDAGGAVDAITVRDACERYAKDLEITGGKKGGALSPERKLAKAREARRRFAQYVNSDPIAAIDVRKLKQGHVKAWRQRLEMLPAAFERAGKGKGRGKGKGTRTRTRAAATVDRDMACLRAALALAVEDGYALTTAPWRKALEATKARGTRDLYLTPEQRRALIQALPVDLAAFVRGLCLLPLRPGALAALRRGDFDSRLGMLKISVDKAGAGREITLPASTAELLKQAAKGKLPGAPLFARADGKAFRADEWGRAIKAAAKTAELPTDTVAYTLRHSSITDLVTGGLDLLTVAQISGTSVAMIESTYGKLRQDRARDALAGLAL